MIELILVINYTPGRVCASPEEFFKLCDSAYKPIFQACDEMSLPITHCFNARTLEMMKDHRQQELIELLRKMRDSNQAEFVSKGFSSAVFSDLPETDIHQQLMFAREIEEEILGHASKGFMPEDGWLDVFVPVVLREHSFEWSLLSGLGVLKTHADGENLQCRCHEMIAMDDVRFPTLCTFVDQNNQLRGKLHDVFRGKVDAKEMANELFLLAEKQTANRPIMVLRVDAEISSISGNAIASIQRFRFLLQCLQGIGSFHFCLPDEVVHRQDNAPPQMYSNLNWDKRLQFFLSDARTEIMAAQKRDPDAALLRRAWKSLLVAEEYRAYKLNSMGKRFYKLYIKSCERARLARDEARQV